MSYTAKVKGNQTAIENTVLCKSSENEFHRNSSIGEKQRNLEGNETYTKFLGNFQIAIVYSVAWPSGLRRWFKAPVSSEAWVRVPPLPVAFNGEKNINDPSEGFIYIFF